MAGTKGAGSSSLELRFTELLAKLGLEIPRGRRRPIAQDQRLGEEIMEAFLDKSGQQLVELLRGKNGSDGNGASPPQVKVPLHQLEAVVSLFYSTIHDVYIGVDSHPPSRFLEVHPFLLGTLAANDAEDAHARPSPPGHHECHAPRWVRIIPFTPEQLQEDYARNPGRSRRYFAEHTRRGITLLCVDPHEQDLAQDDVLQGEWSGDLGLWVNTCALLFEENIKPWNDQLRLELVYPHDGRFDNYLRYVGRLIEVAQEVRLKGSEIRATPLPQDLREHLLWSLQAMFQPKLADAWDEFVGARKRVSKLGPFVERRIEEAAIERPAILDAATGIGCDSLYLTARGIDVTSNEIDARLIAHAMERSEQDGHVPMNLKRFDWRHFEHLAPTETFDVVLALGNSLSCLRSESDVRAVLARFAHLLRPRGLLIIDERNYPVMFKQQREMADPRFRFPGQVVYCSQTIQARPKHIPEKPGIDGDLLTLEYIRASDGSPVGTFDVLPFADGQVKALLEESGFRSVKEYFNLSTRGDPGRAQFVTYVASRTYDGSDFAPGRRRVESVIAFTDITGSGEAKARLGQATYAAEWEAHAKRVHQMVRRHGGRVVNPTGDGFLISFGNPEAAVRCLSGIVADPGTSKLVVRAGLTVGSAIQDRQRNLRGRDVDIAARICDQARPNLVVADDRLRLRVPREWAPLGALELKGAGEWELWRLER
jgi:class 3 adenylate cyclase/SAM-dependent methyltransferase